MGQAINNHQFYLRTFKFPTLPSKLVEWQYVVECLFDSRDEYHSSSRLCKYQLCSRFRSGSAVYNRRLPAAITSRLAFRNPASAARSAKRLGRVGTTENRIWLVESVICVMSKQILYYVTEYDSCDDMTPLTIYDEVLNEFLGAFLLRENCFCTVPATCRSKILFESLFLMLY